MWPLKCIGHTVVYSGDAETNVIAFFLHFSEAPVWVTCNLCFVGHISFLPTTATAGWKRWTNSSKILIFEQVPFLVWDGFRATQLRHLIYCGRQRKPAMCSLPAAETHAAPAVTKVSIEGGSAIPETWTWQGVHPTFYSRKDGFFCAFMCAEKSQRADQCPHRGLCHSWPILDESSWIGGLQGLERVVF